MYNLLQKKQLVELGLHSVVIGRLLFTSVVDNYNQIHDILQIAEYNLHPLFWEFLTM